MVDVGRRAQPQLRAVLPAREHHRKVVLPRHQELPLLLLAELGDAADQVCDVLS